MFGGEFEFKPFSFELQNNISHIYFNRIWASIAYRFAYYGNQRTGGGPDTLTANNKESPYLHSLLFRVNLAVSSAPVKPVPLKVTINFLAALKLTAMQNKNPNDDFHLGWGFGVEF